MKKALVLSFVIVLAALAGCSQFSSGGNSAPSDSNAERTQSDAIPTTTTQQPTPQGGDSETTGSFDTSIQSDEILVSGAELPTGYQYQGESRHLRNESSTSQQDQMEASGMILSHNRAFATDNASLPAYVFSSVAVYEDATAAEQWLSSHTSDLQQEYGANVEQQTISTAVQITVVRFENDDGGRTIGYYRQQDNLVYYTAVSGDDYNPTLTTDLFTTMLRAVEA